MINAIHFIIITGLGLTVARTTKLILDRIHKNKKDQTLFKDGGMPSCHTAIVSSLMAGIFFIEGFTTAFAVSFVFGALVVHDSMHIRRQIGFHAEYLNKTKKGVKFKEDTGHKLSEVIVGFIVGVAVALVYVLLI